MLLYFGIAIVLFALAFARLAGCIDERYEPALALCLTLAAYAISFLRWETGTDWDNYFSMYQNLTTIADARAQTWWGPAYSYLAVLVNSLGGNYSMFLLCVATVLFAAKFDVLLKTCDAPLVAIFVLFCADFYDIYFVRQHVATIFFWLFAYYYYKERRVLAWTAALIAIAFHYSAALPIGIAVLCMNLHWKRLVVIAAGAACAAYFVITHISIENLMSLTTLGSYLGTDWVEVKDSALSTTVRDYLKLAFWFLIVAAGYLWFARRSGTQSECDWSSFCLRCGTGILLVSLVLLPVSEVFARVPAYAVPLLAVVLSNYRLRLRALSVPGTVYVGIVVALFAELAFAYNAYPEAYYPMRWALG